MSNKLKSEQFQFQTGSIKSDKEADRYFIDDAFQFQTGSIKSGNIAAKPKLCLMSFNSKLVRLKETMTLKVYIRSNEFQFQTGSIKRANQARIVATKQQVSIPNWFD